MLLRRLRSGRIRTRTTGRSGARRRSPTCKLRSLREMPPPRAVAGLFPGRRAAHRAVLPGLPRRATRPRAASSSTRFRDEPRRREASDRCCSGSPPSCDRRACRRRKSRVRAAGAGDPRGLARCRARRGRSRRGHGARDDPPPQPQRVQQHDPRPDRPGPAARPTTSRPMTSATASTTSPRCSPRRRSWSRWSWPPPRR